MLIDGTTGKTGRLRVYSRHPPLLEGPLFRSSIQSVIEQQTVRKLHGKFVMWWSSGVYSYYTTKHTDSTTQTTTVVLTFVFKRTRSENAQLFT